MAQVLAEDAAVWEVELPCDPLSWNVACRLSCHRVYRLCTSLCAGHLDTYRLEVVLFPCPCLLAVPYPFRRRSGICCSFVHCA